MLIIVCRPVLTSHGRLWSEPRAGPLGRQDFAEATLTRRRGMSSLPSAITGAVLTIHRRRDSSAICTDSLSFWFPQITGNIRFHGPLRTI